MTALARRPAAALVALSLLLAACASEPSPNGSAAPAPSVASGSPPSSAAPTAAGGEIEPAPGSDSEVYAPNPAAVVVAVDPGHGGCLDWGVPNPWDNTVEKAEKADTLAIGLALRDLLEAQGVTVVMIRDEDVALAGDDYPQLNCTGPPWRDVDGDGEAGFEQSGRTRTRDELQARIDLANLVRADVLVSIHVNSMTQDGVVYEIAATQAFFDDETPWGAASGSLAAEVQDGVVATLDQAARYERQDRGTQAVAYYMISRQWRDGDSCETEGDTWCKPHRGIQLPAVLAEIGSMSLEAESELLATDAGRAAVAAGLYEGLRDWFAARPVAVRYDALVPGGEAGAPPPPAEGDGPMFWAAPLALDAAGQLPLRLTNTGQEAWPAGLELAIGWAASDAPYLAERPELSPTAFDVPALEPGESVLATVPMTPPDGGRSIAWIELIGPNGGLADAGSPALQLASDPADG